MEFFSTFGGSTVSCAVGDCVLEITQRERLQEHALAVGKFLGEQFLSLQANFPWIGDVRGSGLFWGLDIVADPQTRRPDGARAKFIKQRLCDLGVLIGTDGSHDHVLKIRPPLPFTATDAERLVQALARACRES
jgi:4-aminobutyrate aminotransferase-like enzyme